MKLRVLPAAVAVLTALGAAGAAGEKRKGAADLSWFPFWTAKGAPMAVAQYVPGLTAILELTEEQKEQLAGAWRETLGSEEFMELGRAVKLDPNASEERRRAAQDARDRAHGQLQSKTAAILTPRQKEWIAQVGLLYAEASEQVQAEIAAAKRNGEDVKPLLERVHERRSEEFLRRLVEVLTPEQRAAMERAAAGEKRRESAAANGKKE